MNIRIGISPCPNDTFIFDAIYRGLIDTSPFSFEFVFEDVETLNHCSETGELDMLKISYAQYFRVLNNYLMLPSGSALGFGVGPLLIAREELSEQQIDQAHIAIPGHYTTAHFLLQFAYPDAVHKTAMIFSDIEQAVLDGRVDAGVIIHENRFTYAQKGLTKIADLGAYWESQTGLPIPLGGIAVRRNMHPTHIRQISELIRESISYGLSHGNQLSNFVRCHAQEMDEDVIGKHIELYVNEQSLWLDDLGNEAVQFMYSLTGLPSDIKLIAK